MVNLHTRNRYLLKNIALFSIGSIGTKVINFFLVPMYTNVMLTSEYGIVDLITTIATIGVPIITFNFGEAITRFALDKNANYRKILTNEIMIIIVSLILGIMIIPIFECFDILDGYASLIYWYIVSNGSCEIFLSYLRGREYVLEFSIGNLLHTFCIAVLNIGFLTVFQMGIKGFFLAYIISNMVTIIYACIMGHVFQTIQKLEFEFAYCINMLKFSVVLIPTSFMWWIINSSDRAMVSAMVGTAANGIYAISYKVPTLMSTISNIVTKSWAYSAIKENESKDRDEYTNQVFEILSAFVIILCSGMLMIMKKFLEFYVALDYYEAWKYTPYLSIGYVFMTLGTFLSTSYTVNKDSKAFLISGTCGAVVNILLNWILIPYIGISGAALATCLSYIAVFTYRAVDVRRYVNIQIITKRRIVAIVILLIQGFSMFMEGWKGNMILLLEFLVILILYKELVRNFYKRIVYEVRAKR